MQQQTVSVNSNTEILVQTVPGDLRVAGWDRNEIMAKTDGEELVVEPDEGPVTISCDENLILYLPRTANLTVVDIRGDASLQALRGQLSLGQVAGDLSLRDTGPVAIDSVAGDMSVRGSGNLVLKSISGDFTVHGIHGDLVVESVGGDASLRDVEGNIHMPTVGSDLYIRNVRGAVTCNTGSDTTLYIQPQAGMEYHITTGDDLILRLPADASAELHLNGGSPESIHVDFPGITLDGENLSYDLTIGSGDAKIFLTAGDELVVTSRADQWDSHADFGVGMRDGIDGAGIPPIPPIPPIPHIPPLPPDFSDRINRRVQEAMNRAQSKVDLTNRRVEIKVEAAVRRAEAKARAAEARARRGQANVNVGRWHWDLASSTPEQKNEPVSDDERLTILKLLKDKKITIEEAEQLLAALEGK